MVYLWIKKRPKSKISQQIPDIFIRLLSCCFPQEKDLLGQGKSVIYASMWKTGYCDTLKKALDRILWHTKHSPKTEQRSGFQRAFMLVFKFGVWGSKIYTKGFIIWLSLLFIEFGISGFKKPRTKPLKLHFLPNCFDTNY